MFNLKTIKRNLSKIIAITEKNIKLQLRFKFNVIMGFITPIVSIIMPLIVIQKFFEMNAQFGSWTERNYLVFIIMAYKIFLLRGSILLFPNQFREEKFWKTLPSLIIAPLNRFNILFGIFFSHLILISIPFALFFVICYLIYPISIITALFVIGIYLLIALIFSGIGIIIGIFAISKESFATLLQFFVVIFFWMSCIIYPFELFPDFIQNVINLNPLYYIFDFLRFSWIENNIIITIISHPFHFFILIVCSTAFPCIGIYIFNKVYKKYGIVGY